MKLKLCFFFFFWGGRAWARIGGGIIGVGCIGNFVFGEGGGKGVTLREGERERGGGGKNGEGFKN